MAPKSLFALFTASLACVASAYTTPKGDSPEGNPISQPGLNSIVPVGKEFSITWQPTTQGTVTLVLLKGPASDAEPQYAIVEKIENSGTYVWTPSTSLAPSTGATGYGIQLIDDATGQYQYTTQFGISNPDYDASAASSSSSSWTDSPASTSWAGYGHGGSWSTTATTSAATTTSKVHKSTGTAPIVTGVSSVSSGIPHNVTMVPYTGSMTVPTSLKTSTHATSTVASTTAPATASATANGAAAMRTSFVGLVFAGAVAVFAL